MRLIRRAAYAIAVGCLLLVGAPAPAADEPFSDIDPIGKPEQFAAGKRTMVAVWFEDGTWYLRATSKEGTRRKIEGRVTVQGGKLISGDLDGTESAADDSGKKGKRARRAENNDDDIAVHGDRAGFDFRFVAHGQADGLRFKVGEKARTVTFNFRVADDDSPGQVFIGKAGRHPDKLPFALTANPQKK